MSYHEAERIAQERALDAVRIERERRLDELQIADNTLLMFLTDNGGCSETPGGNDTGQVPGPRDFYSHCGPDWARAENTPFRKYKSYTYEGGVATPLVVHRRVDRGAVDQQHELTRQGGGTAESGVARECFDASLERGLEPGDGPGLVVDGGARGILEPGVVFMQAERRGGREAQVLRVEAREQGPLAHRLAKLDRALDELAADAEREIGLVARADLAGIHMDRRSAAGADLAHQHRQGRRRRGLDVLAGGEREQPEGGEQGAGQGQRHDGSPAGGTACRPFSTRSK